MAYRWIPQNSREITHRLGVAYVYEVHRELYTAYLVCAYTNRSKKAVFHESYGRVDARDKRVADFFSGLESHERIVQENKAQRSRPHSLKPGDILHHSWGWEQTQCDFYQVLSVTEHKAIIQAIGDETVDGSTYSHGMADRRVAVKDSFHGEPFRVSVNGRNQVGASKGVLSHGCCNVWDGKPQYCSWYA